MCFDFLIIYVRLGLRKPIHKICDDSINGKKQERYYSWEAVDILCNSHLGTYKGSLVKSAIINVNKLNTITETEAKGLVSLIIVLCFNFREGTSYLITSTSTQKNLSKHLLCLKHLLF